MHPYTLGVVFIFVCASLWAGSSVLIQFIYQNLSFDSPFLLTYLATSLLVFHLPYWYLKEGYEIWRGEPTRQPSVPLPQDDMDDVDGNISFVTMEGQNTKTRLIHRNVQEPLSHLEICKLAMIIAPLWFTANCLYNYSLLMTTVSSSTIISNLSAAFTLLFSSFLHLEDVTALKVLGVIVCFLGAICTGLNDDGSDQKQTVTGDIVAFLGAAGYGLYTTAIRYCVPDEDRVPMHLLLGYIGLVNALMIFPIILIMYFQNVGGVSAVSGQAVGFVCLNGFADTVLADYFWARAVLLTSPTVATIGMSVTIPIALLTDYFIDGVQATALAGGGAVLVTLGFILVNVTQENVAQAHEVCRRQLRRWMSHRDSGVDGSRG